MGGGSSKSVPAPRTSNALSSPHDKSGRGVSGGSIRRRRASNAAAEIAVAVGSSGESKEKRYNKATYDKIEKVSICVPGCVRMPSSAASRCCRLICSHARPNPPGRPLACCINCRATLQRYSNQRSCVQHGMRLRKPTRPLMTTLIWSHWLTW